MELKVIYDAKGKIDSKLDKEIREALLPLGFKFYASGCDRTNGKRDLGFKRED